NLSLLLLSVLIRDELHVSDFLVDVLLNPEMKAAFPTDEARQALYAFTDRKGFEGPLKRPDLWALSPKDDERINSALGISNFGAPIQLISITRREVSLRDWGQVRIGYLKNIAITRRNLICYVANKLGGVHYDSKRLPSDLGDAEQF